MNYRSYDLDRSHSLSSNSSASSSGIGPITPSLMSSPAFTDQPIAPSQKYQPTEPTVMEARQSALSALNGNGPSGRTPSLRDKGRTGFGSIRDIAKEANGESKRSSWTPGHRTSVAGGASVDSSRSGRYSRSQSYGAALSTPQEEESVNVTPSWKTNDRPLSPPLHPISSPNFSSLQRGYNAPPSPVRSSSPTSYNSTTNFSAPQEGSRARPLSLRATTDRSLASSIFSNRDSTPNAALSLNPDSPKDFSRSAVNSVRALTGLTQAEHDQVAGMSRSGSVRRGMAPGHRRTQTLPSSGLAALNLPTIDPNVEEVAGLTGRIRLSHPADSPALFTPSSVYSSSRHISASANDAAPASPAGGNRRPISQGGGLLPSQTVKAIDQQRENLVAYEYLCHVAEAKAWLDSNIRIKEDMAPLWGDSIADFEQSLRNGYALAHLARSLGGKKGRIVLPDDRPTNGYKMVDYATTDNIVMFLDFVQSVGLPEIFRFETVDLYNAKNLPKVIYCIHALSHLLARRADVNGMNALSGQIAFTDDDFNAKQNGLAGVRLPDFGRLGKALGRQIEEEPEPETDEQERDRLLSENIDWVVGLQSVARAMVAHRRFQHELRRQKQEQARLRREEEDRLRLVAEEESRIRYEREAALRREAEEREMMLRREAEEREMTLRREAEEEELRLRREAEDRDRALRDAEQAERDAREREEAARRHHADQVRKAIPTFIQFQALARATLVQQRLSRHIATLRSSESFVTKLQAAIRRKLVQDSYDALRQNFRRVDVVRSLGGISQLARAALVKKRIENNKKELGFVEPDVVGVQSQIRGVLARWKVDEIFSRLNDEAAAVRLQSLWRGILAKHRYWDELDHYRRNLDKVVRLQAFIRSRKTQNQYQQLRLGKNVPVSTIKNFVNLLDDSEFDYREELEVERLKLELVRSIREAQGLEDDVKDLDIKIALLVKNTITYEVARSERARTGGMAALQRGDVLASAKDPFAPSNLDAQTQRKFELYQQLFWHLQATPEYLARLFANVGKLGMSEKMQKSVEATTFLVFGFAQNSREEYLLLKLFRRSIQEELAFLPNVEAFARGHFTFIRLIVRYGRGAKEKKYLKSMLAPQVEAILAKTEMDLTLDPVSIHHASINAEETATGRASNRAMNVDLRSAMADLETRRVFIDHLKSLRAATDAFLSALTRSTRDMPFGVRYIAREVAIALRKKFPGTDEKEVMRAVGHLVYYRFIQPAIVAPDTFDIIERVVPAKQRNNLGEISKMLNQISVGRVFGSNDAHLMALNPFLESCIKIFGEWIADVIHVPDAEVHFRVDDYSDATSARSPVIYISPNDIYATHSLIHDNLDIIVPEQHDPLRDIIVELGGAPGVSSTELSRARADEIALTLMTRIRAQEDPEAGKKALFNLAKRRVIAILKVHSGANLEAVLAQPPTEEDEDEWERIVDDEIRGERAMLASGEISNGGGHARMGSVLQNDLRSLTFAEIKQDALANIIELRNLGLVSRNDRYQTVLDSIASDILSKHHRRMQRRNELGTLRSTLSSLTDKKRYLNGQIKSYHVYIEQSMASTQKNKKKRFNLPWSHQAAHLRDIAKTGREYSLGTYSYTAQRLYDDGVLLSIDQFSQKQFDKIAITISSNVVGVFELSAKVGGISMPGGTVEVGLEELLEAQFAGKSTYPIGDVAKANLNLLVHLINRKFFCLSS